MSEPKDKSEGRVLRILHLEDNDRDAELVASWMEDEGILCQVKRVQTASEFLSALGSKDVEVIISDYKLPGFDGLKALDMARQRLPDVPFILFSGTIGEELAVQSLKQGAADYVLKERPQRLMAAIRHALDGAEQRARAKEAENRVREQAALLNKARDAIMVTDMEERITFWNPSAERIYGWSADEVTGQRADLLLKGNPQLLREAIRGVSERGEWQGELTQRRRDGTALVIESRWSLLGDGEDRPGAKLVINTDVTERKELEAQFLRVQRMQGIGALAGGIAHDLNNVLAPINMGIEILAEEITADEKEKILAMMKNCARRGIEMVKQIVSFVRGVGGDACVMQVEPLISEMARLAQDSFPRSLRIEAKIDPDLPSIVGNQTQLHQVLLNLCINARDAMPGGGELRLSANRSMLEKYLAQGELKPVSGNFVVLSVSDTGSGIRPEVLGRIFQPFFTTKDSGKGTGIGLSTVVGIAKRHNGFVEVESEVGKGTTFKVYVPEAGSENVAAPEENRRSEMENGEQILVQ